MENDSGIWPVDDRLLVQLPEAEEKTSGGIILTEHTKSRENEASTIATVIAIGETANCNELEFFPKVGDRVMMTRYAGMAHFSSQPEFQRFRVIRGDDVVAIVESVND